jgi:bifunctional non-homologous end joining protein LigD
VTILRAFPICTIDTELTKLGGNSWDVANLKYWNELELVIFDILILNGEELIGKPNHERRDILDRLAMAMHDHDVSAVKIIDVFPVTEKKVREIWAAGGEGAIIKHRDAIYRPGYRTDRWIKVKKLISATCVITGFQAGENGPFSTVLVKHPTEGWDTKVKTLNNDWLRRFAKDAQSYVGKQLRIEHQGIHASKGKKSARHPMWDHIVEEGR